MKNINTLLEKLYSLKQTYNTKTLDKINELCQYLDNPHLNYPTIHIAGTNGKGSVCSLLSSVLQESSYKVGLYTSPHIFKFNERIKINGVCISDDEIAKIYNSIDTLATDINASFFDITTAIAFEYFSKNEVDVAIIETGLGGRLDSTNIVQPILSIITSISLDHTDILGTDLIDIIKEKAGIIKEDVPVIIQDTNPEILSPLITYANKVNAPVYVSYNFPYIEFIEYSKPNNDVNLNYRMVYSIANDSNIDNFRSEKKYFFDDNFLQYEFEIKRYSPLLGKHQLNNIKLVWFASLFIQINGGKIKKGDINKGIENVIQNTGIQHRINNISKTDKPIILDVSHNKESINSLVNTISEIYENMKWNIIFSVMQDKNITQMLQKIKPICNTLILPKLDMERSASPNLIKTKAQILGFKDIIIKKDIFNACDLIKSLNAPSLICGTFYNVPDVISYFE